MPYSGWELYLLFCIINTIYCYFKLYVPCWSQIKKQPDEKAKRIAKRPITSLLVFGGFTLLMAPVFFIIALSNFQSEKFVLGFVHGSTKND